LYDHIWVMGCHKRWTEMTPAQFGSYFKAIGITAKHCDFAYPILGWVQQNSETPAVCL
jgi:hypothetical protein